MDQVEDLFNFYGVPYCINLQMGTLDNSRCIKTLITIISDIIYPVGISFHLCSRNCHTTFWLPSLFAIFVNPSVVLILSAISRYLQFECMVYWRRKRELCQSSVSIHLCIHWISHMFWIHCSLVQDKALSRIFFSYAM